MKINIPLDKPILIYTVYRSGSTAFQNYIANALNYKNFTEPYRNEKNNKTAEDFQKYKVDNTDYVWKLMPDHVTEQNHDEIMDIWNNSFVIKLKRRNLVEQIASWVLSMENRKWNSKEDTTYNEIDIDKETIEKLSDITIAINQSLDNLDSATFHAELYYEDLDLSDSEYKKLNKPACYDEICTIIKQHLDNKGIQYV